MTEMLTHKGRWRPSGQLLLLAGLLLLGALLRFLFLGRALLWIDEWGVMVPAAVERTPGQIIAEIYSQKFQGFTGQHMPLHYVWLNLFLHAYKGLGIAAPGAGLIRLPFALIALMSLPVFYAVGRDAYGRGTGLWALGLAAMSFFHVYQSRDATSYAVLFFFLALNLLGLVRLCVPDEDRRRRIRAGLILLAGSLGAVSTHLSASLLVIAEGMLLAAVVVVIALRRSGGAEGNYFARARFLVPALAVLGVSLLPAVPLLLAVTQGGGMVGLVKSQKLSVPLVLYQLAHFGWGRGGGRLLGFGLAALAGVFAAVRSPATRNRALVHLGLCVVPAAIYFAVSFRDLFPRYLTVVFYPLLLLAARGLQAMTGEVSRRLGWEGRMRTVPVCAVCALIAAWSVGPYRVMLAMKDKSTVMSRVVDWLGENVPEGGLYVWRNGHFMREVPGMYPTPGRQAAFGAFPGPGVTPEGARWWSDNARTFFDRFPLAPLIVEPDRYYDPERWNWIYSDFARQSQVGDDSYARLWAWGLSSGGLGETSALSFVVFQNTEEDVLQRDRAAGRISIWPDGPNWQYVQNREGNLFVLPRDRADLKVTKHTAGVAAYHLVVQGSAMEGGSVAAVLYKSGGGSRAWRADFGRANPLELRLGPIELGPGIERIAVSVTPSDRMVAVFHAFRLEPAPAPAPAGESLEANSHVDTEDRGP